MTNIKDVLKNNFQEINSYSEEEALIKPYFFVQILNSSETKELNNRYKRTINFEISYVSDQQNINEDYINKVDELYEIFKTVEVSGNKFRALNLNHEVKEKILYFRFQVTFTLLKSTEEISMDKMEVDVGGK